MDPHRRDIVGHRKRPLDNVVTKRHQIIRQRDQGLNKNAAIHDIEMANGTDLIRRFAIRDMRGADRAAPGG